MCKYIQFDFRVNNSQFCRCEFCVRHLLTHAHCRSLYNTLNTDVGSGQYAAQVTYRILNSLPESVYHDPTATLRNIKQ